MRAISKNEHRTREVLAHERNRLIKPFGSGWNVALVYPNTYHVGMSNLGFQFVYETIASHPEFLCERVFTDLDRPLSVESRRPLSDFNIIAFSISYELDFLNVVRLLSRSGIATRAQDRASRDPLIIAGGIALTVNANPVADFVDLVAYGDGEATLPTFLRAFADSGGDKRRTIAALEGHPGFRAPARATEDTLLETDLALEIAGNLLPCHTTIYTPATEFPDTCLIEIARGCPYRCRFCFSGSSILPYRVFPLKKIRPIIEHNTRFTKRFGFISSAVARHPEINALCDYCEERDLMISFSSLHLLDISPRILKALVHSGQKTLTLAPEAGNETLRRQLGKHVSDQRILDIVELCVQSGMQNLKLYFLIGAPGESLDDCHSIVHLVKNVQKVFIAGSRKGGRIGSIRVQPSIFVPKPHTPCANAPMLIASELRRRLDILRRGLAPLANVRLLPVSIYEALAQGILSLGDRSASRLLLHAVQHGGTWRTAVEQWKHHPHS